MGWLPLTTVECRSDLFGSQAALGQSLDCARSGARADRARASVLKACDQELLEPSFGCMVHEWSPHRRPQAHQYRQGPTRANGPRTRLWLNSSPPTQSDPSRSNRGRRPAASGTHTPTRLSVCATSSSYRIRPKRCPGGHRDTTKLVEWNEVCRGSMERNSCGEHQRGYSAVGVTFPT